MATQLQVKEYLAYWFQLGKCVAIGDGTKFLSPKSVLHGDQYSDEFESGWQQLLAADLGDCYLEGTTQTIAQLLSFNWELIECARCQLTVPTKITGNLPGLCVCDDLTNWPNFDLPAPRLPLGSRRHLDKICSDLVKKEEE